MVGMVTIGFIALTAIYQISALPIRGSSREISSTELPLNIQGEDSVLGAIPLEYEELLMDVIHEENSVVSYYASDFIPSSLHNHTQGFSLVRVRNNVNERICLYLPLVQGVDFTRQLKFENHFLKLSAPLLINVQGTLNLNQIQSWDDLGGLAVMSMYVNDMCDLKSIYRVSPSGTYLKGSTYPYSATLDMTSLLSAAGKESGELVDLKTLLSDLSKQLMPSVDVDMKTKVTDFHTMQDNSALSATNH